MESSAETARRFLALSNARCERSQRRGFRPKLEHGETALVREKVLEHIGRVPVPPSILHRRVVDDIGEVGFRRLWRAVRLLRRLGCIEKIGPRHTGDGYVRTAKGDELLALLQAIPLGSAARRGCS